MADLIFLVFLLIVLAVIATKSVAITKEGECLVVFRLGRLFRVCPPGPTVSIPFIDRAVRVRVDRIPGWQALSEQELEERIVQVALKQLGPAR